MRPPGALGGILPSWVIHLRHQSASGLKHMRLARVVTKEFMTESGRLLLSVPVLNQLLRVPCHFTCLAMDAHAMPVILMLKLALSLSSGWS